MGSLGIFGVSLEWNRLYMGPWAGIGMVAQGLWNKCMATQGLWNKGMATQGPGPGPWAQWIEGPWGHWTIGP